MPPTTVPATRGCGVAVVAAAVVAVGAGDSEVVGVWLVRAGGALGADVVPLSPAEEHAASEIPALQSRSPRRLVRTSTGRA
jgi:hypothetical protein